MIMKNIGSYILLTGSYTLIKSENGNRPLRHIFIWILCESTNI